MKRKFITVYDKNDNSFIAPPNSLAIDSFGFNEYQKIISDNDTNKKCNDLCFVFFNFKTFFKFFKKLNEEEREIYLDNGNISFYNITNIIFSLEEIYDKECIDIFKITLAYNLIDYYVLPSEQAIYNLAKKTHNNDIGYKNKLYIGNVGLTTIKLEKRIPEFDYVIPLTDHGLNGCLYSLSEFIDNLHIDISIGLHTSYLKNESLLDVKRFVEELNNSCDISLIEGFIGKIPKFGFILPFNSFYLNYLKDFYTYIYQSKLPIYSLNAGCLKELNIYPEYRSDCLDELISKFNIDLLPPEIMTTNSFDLNLLSWEYILENISNFIDYKLTGKITNEAIKKDMAIYNLFNRHYNNYGEMMYDYLSGKLN